jgi:hypothetical protein
VRKRISTCNYTGTLCFLHVQKLVGSGQQVVDATPSMFINEQAVFSGLVTPPQPSLGIIYRISVISPFTGAVVHADCPPVDVLADLAKLEVSTQPSQVSYAGLAFSMQPTVALYDAFGNIVTDKDFPFSASICVPCPCPCVAAPKDFPGITYRDICTGVIDKYSRMFNRSNTGAVCAHGLPVLSGSESTSSLGYVYFSQLKMHVAAEEVRLLISVTTLPNIYVASASFKVASCTPQALVIDASAPLLDFADTERPFCGGKPCLLQVVDAFGNLVDSSLDVLVQVELEPVPASPQAGLTISSRCKCTGKNGVVNVGSLNFTKYGRDYGKSCSHWDSKGLNCDHLWSPYNCIAGQWCCRPWCYVDPSCPFARKDPLVEGLYYAYEACSEDLGTLQNCPYYTEGSCEHRQGNNIEIPSNTTLLLGTTVLMSRSGLAIFTDLRTTNPGVFSLTFTARSGAQVLVLRKDMLYVTPLYAKKLVVLREPGNSTFVGSALRVQPQVQLQDVFGNKVLNDFICTAVTAVIGVHNATNPQGQRVTGVQVFGQQPGDTQKYCEDRAGAIRCIITANAVDAIVDFTALQLDTQAADGLIVNFTTGCCEPDPEQCFCASAAHPLRVDVGRPTTGPLTEPCQWVASKPFSLKRPVGSLRLEQAPRSAYRAGEAIHVTVAVLDQEGGIVLSSNDDFVAKLIDSDTPLYGTSTVPAKAGKVTFTDLQLRALPTVVSARTFSMRIQMAFQPGIFVTTPAFTLSPAAPVQLLVNRSVSVVRASAPLDAALTVRDAYGNQADGVGITLSASLLSATYYMNVSSSVEVLRGSLNTTFVRGVAQYSNPVIPGASAMYLMLAGEFIVRISGGGSLVANIPFTVLPGTVLLSGTSWYRERRIPKKIVAWEAFIVELELLDAGGNFASTTSGADVDVRLMVRDSSMLRDTFAEGFCLKNPENGIIYMDDCRAVQLTANAQEYPITVEFALSICAEGCSVYMPVTIYAPVVSLAVDVCVSEDTCRLYNMPDCTCQSASALIPPQVQGESFFNYPRVRVLDTAGQVVEHSTLPIWANLTQASLACAVAIGKSRAVPSKGVAAFDSLGVNIACEDVINPELTFVLSAVHLDTGKPGLRDIVNPNTVSWSLFTTPPVTSVALMTQPTDTLAGVPTKAQIRVTMFSQNTVARRSARVINAELRSWKNNARDVTPVLMGKTSMRSVNGTAVFTDLTLATTGSYTLRFWTTFAGQSEHRVLYMSCLVFQCKQGSDVQKFLLSHIPAQACSCLSHAKFFCTHTHTHRNCSLWFLTEVAQACKP